MAEPVVVVGAGAAGIVSAWRAAQLGARVVLLEKTERIGTKILISGGGKCNITHAGPVEEVLREFRPNEARFLRPSFYRFFNDDVLDLLTARGLRVYTRPNGRVFPVDQTAKDVVAILSKLLTEVGVDVRLNTPVTGLLGDSVQISGVQTSQSTIKSAHVIVAVGGSSYPKTGTTGDGWAWARALGHRVVPVRAALAPIELQLPQGSQWAGISLRDIELVGRANGKSIARWRDDLLFTHHGISGPTALGISREVEEHRVRTDVRLEVDLIPTQTFEKVQANLQAQKAQKPNITAAALVPNAIPSALHPEILNHAGIQPHVKLQQLSGKQVNLLAQTFKGWVLGTVTKVPLEKGEVVAGGISLDEVDPHTMKSKKVEHLSFCGEVLDIAGPVGGYNLQAAFSTGFVAGEEAVSGEGRTAS